MARRRKITYVDGEGKPTFIKPSNKIESIAELKKAIINEEVVPGTPHHDGILLGLDKALQKINEFEASVKERIAEYNDNAKLKILHEIKISGHALQVALGDELRRILGVDEKSGVK